MKYQENELRAEVTDDGGWGIWLGMGCPPPHSPMGVCLGREGAKKFLRLEMRILVHSAAILSAKLLWF